MQALGLPAPRTQNMRNINIFSGFKTDVHTIGDYRDSNMPDSPETKTQSTPTTVSPTAPAPSITPLNRPMSTNSSVSGSLNGAHSPLGSLNGRTPSPPSMANQTAGQQLPPACGARQLSKLKRFLTTLQQFGSDISPEIGERVRSLVLGLVNSHLSIEEFHGKLQEATNFPLRPFVIPFLKANLPLLQRELLHCARLAKQTPQQYLAHNEHILFDPSHSPMETQDIMAELNENGKRRSPDSSSSSRPKENGTEQMEPMHPAKRHHPNHPNHPVSPGSNNRISPNGAFFTGGPIRLEDISMSREMRERERIERERMERERLERERHFNNFNYNQRPPFEHLERPLDRIDDDWKHVETMLHCIIDMVDKTKRALNVLQERSTRDREELQMWMRRHAEGLDQDMKKRTSELMATTLRQTEDRVTEVKRRAEEAVNEVKRQAVAELQKAVAAAESKASELVTAEKAKMERAISEARSQAKEEVMTTIGQQEESSESCWNCGRKASETCSGCNVARYCGSYCQHKDWENHHHVCGSTAVAQGRQSSEAKTAPPATTEIPAVPAATTTASSAPVAPVSSAASAVAAASSPLSVTSPANSLTSVSLSGSRSSTPAETMAAATTKPETAATTAR